MNANLTVLFSFSVHCALVKRDLDTKEVPSTGMNDQVVDI